jgi:hypothetical protein
MNKELLEEQYQEIAEVVESEGLGYALTDGGYIRPDMTDDPDLKEAIQKAIDSCKTIMKIIKPYLP